MADTKPLLEDAADLREVRDALYRQHERFNENIETLTSVHATLAAGHPVAMFAPGEAGVRAAKGMRDEMTARVERITAIIERINARIDVGLDAEDDEADGK